MRTIHFTAGLFEDTWRIIKESHDCMDIAKDLGTIQNTIHYGSDLEAESLDSYLRKKYPIIEVMLNIADSMQIHSYSLNSNSAISSPYKSRLQ